MLILILGNNLGELRIMVCFVWMMAIVGVEMLACSVLYLGGA